MTRARLTGDHPILLMYTDTRGSEAAISVGGDAVIIDGVVFTARFLKGLAALSNPSHFTEDCVWENCPEHACPYDHSHTQHFCGRPTCRVS